MTEPTETNPATVAPLPTKALVRLMLALAVLAAGLSFYLTLAAARSSGLAGCGEGSGCNTVLTSPWAKVLGFPVAGGALLLYALVFIQLQLLGSARWTATPRRLHLLRCGCTTLACAILAAAGWFTFLQANVLKAFCPWCMATHATGALLAVLLLGTLAPKLRAALPAAALGLGLIAILITIQIFKPTPTHRLVAYQNVGIDVSKYPILGDPHAPQVLVLLFDYTCPNCRMLHGYIQQAATRWPKRFAIVLANVPLEHTCNPHYFDTDPMHEHGCEYARLALTVWRVHPVQFAAYDAWMYAAETPPPIAEARAKVAQLIAPRQLDEVLADGWAADFIKHQIDLNWLLRDKARATGIRIGDGVPTLLLPDHTLLAGRPGTAEEFLALLDNALKKAEALSAAPH